ncbi:unnamed protein product [Linum tenue]|uniref:Uncharacterized protein n=1 Tax=Linum tenue TaxID=586396 RepID=A0AAV0S597_9ROSI|nr:unnamed protein product [Linum tenue]
MGQVERKNTCIIQLRKGKADLKLKTLKRLARNNIGPDPRAQQTEKSPNPNCTSSLLQTTTAVGAPCNLLRRQTPWTHQEEGVKQPHRIEGVKEQPEPSPANPRQSKLLEHLDPHKHRDSLHEEWAVNDKARGRSSISKIIKPSPKQRPHLRIAKIYKAKQEGGRKA